MSTLAAYKNTVTVLLIGGLPLQTYESALALVENYISTAGGWVPTVPADPTGEGLPVGGLNEQDAATTIIAQQFQRVYSCDLNVSATLSITLEANLANGLNSASVLSALESSLKDWLAAQITGAKVTLKSVDSYTGTVTSNGALPSSIQVTLDGLVNGTAKLVDPRAIALKLARSKYTLDNTWNVSKCYTEPSKNIVCIVEKYQSNSYLARDVSATSYYVISVDPNTYAVVSGSSLRY